MSLSQKPPHPKTSFNFFSSLMHAEFKKARPEVTVDFVSFQKRCSAKWQLMEQRDKDPFQLMADADKARCQQERKSMPIDISAKKGKKPLKDPNRPKKPLTAFFLFSNEKRPELRSTNPEYSIGETGKILGQMWRELGEEEKRGYDQKAKVEREKYEAAIKEYQDPGRKSEEGGNDEKQKPLPQQPYGNSNKGSQNEASIVKKDVAKALSDFDRLDSFLEEDAAVPLVSSASAKAPSAVPDGASISDFEKLDSFLDNDVVPPSAVNGNDTDVPPQNASTSTSVGAAASADAYDRLDRCLEDPFDALDQFA